MPDMSKPRRTRGPKSPIAAVIIRARHARGWSQQALAEEADMSRQTIAEIERGEELNPKTETLRKLAHALGIPAGDMIPRDTGGADLSPLIDRFLASDYGRDARPTVEEISWLRALPPITFLGDAPTEKTIDRLLEALRSRRHV